MRKFISGLIVGLILATTTLVFAANPIKLIVNGNEIHPDVPPQIIDGRTLVPARALAEALGAQVDWDGANNAVVVTGVSALQTNTLDTASKDKITVIGPVSTEKSTFQIATDGTIYLSARGLAIGLGLIVTNKDNTFTKNERKILSIGKNNLQESKMYVGDEEIPFQHKIIRVDNDVLISITDLRNANIIDFTLDEASKTLIIGLK